MKKRKTARTIPDPLTPEESGALLAVPNKRYPTGLRNYVMMQLMLAVGLRCAETLNLRIQDVDLISGKLRVDQGKGSKDRILWLNPEMIALLTLWRERREKRGIVSEWYFTTLKGEHLDSRYLRAMLKRYKLRAGIVRKCSPHTLRHTFATNLLKATGNIEIVRKALGHADISTTGVYLHTTDVEMEKALKGFQENMVK